MLLVEGKLVAAPFRSFDDHINVVAIFRKTWQRGRIGERHVVWPSVLISQQQHKISPLLSSVF